MQSDHVLNGKLKSERDKDPTPVSGPRVAALFARDSFGLEQPLEERLHLALRLSDKAYTELFHSRVTARALASAARRRALPTPHDERRAEVRHLLLIAADVSATAWCVEAEAWLLDGEAVRAEAPAAMARLLVLHGSGDPLVFGAVASMLGLRAWLSRDLESSLHHLGLAALHFTDAGDVHRRVEVLARARLCSNNRAR